MRGRVERPAARTSGSGAAWMRTGLRSCSANIGLQSSAPRDRSNGQEHRHPSNSRMASDDFPPFAVGPDHRGSSRYSVRCGTRVARTLIWYGAQAQGCGASTGIEPVSRFSPRLGALANVRDGTPRPLLTPIGTVPHGGKVRPNPAECREDGLHRLARRALNRYHPSNTASDPPVTNLVVTSRPVGDTKPSMTPATMRIGTTPRSRRIARPPRSTSSRAAGACRDRAMPRARIRPAPPAMKIAGSSSDAVRRDEAPERQAHARAEARRADRRR